MRYLCDKHVEVVRTEPEKAYSLWRGARAQGIQAMQKGDIGEAQNLLGVAYDIARVQLAEDIARGSFHISSERFAESVRYHVWVLNRSDQLQEVLGCLENAHDGLLHRAACERANYLDRMSAFEMLKEFRQKRTALLNLLGQTSQACAWGGAAEKLASEIEATLRH